MKHTLKVILWTCYGIISLILLALPPVLEYFGKSKMMMHRFLLARNAEITQNLLTTPVMVATFFVVLIIALGLLYSLYIATKRIIKHTGKRSGLKTLLFVALPGFITSSLLLYYMLTKFNNIKAPSFFVILWGIYLIITFIVSLSTISVNSFRQTEKAKAQKLEQNTKIAVSQVNNKDEENDNK